MTHDTHDTVKRAHKTLRELFTGQKSAYQHASQVELAFYDWLEDESNIEESDLNQDQIRGFDSMSEQTAEKVLSFAEDKHPEVLEG